jgi:hypothetical protein
MKKHCLGQTPSPRLMTTSHSTLLAISISVLLAFACSREPGVWEEARQRDVISEYQRYLDTYPAGEHVAAAQSRIDELKWTEASTADTVEAIQTYLTAFPSGAHKADASARMAFLKDAAWWAQLGSMEFQLAHAGDLASGGFQIGTQMTGLVSLDRNMEVAQFSPGTKLKINVLELRKSGKGASAEYVFVAQFGKVGLFRSEKQGALVYVAQNILVPIPTPREVESDQAADFRDGYDPTRLSMLSQLSGENDKTYDVFSAWKRFHLTDLKRQVNNTDFDKVRQHIGTLALIPLPGAEKWLTDERFKSVRDGPAIAENRKKLLEAIAAAGSIRIAAK